jgi:hypothetical protein
MVTLVTPVLGVKGKVMALRATLLVCPMPPQNDPPDDGMPNVEPVEVRR